MMLLLLVVGVILLMLIRVPVAIAFLLPSLAYLIISPGAGMEVALQQVASGINRFVLLAVPLFILAGNMMNTSGITDRIFHFVQTILGNIQGGLGYVNIVGSVLFAGMSGSAVADTAGLGMVEINAMRKRGYDDRFAIGITASSSVIGPIIPPSIVAVVYGVAASTSIGGLFVAGILPGLLMALMLAVMVYFYAKRRNYPREERASLGEFGRATIKAFPALMTPVVILGGIFTGIFTPTEAAAAAVIYTIVVSVLYRDLGLKGIYQSLVSTVRTTASILLIIGTASLLARIFAREQVPQMLYEGIVGFTDSKVIFLLMVLLLFLLVGTVMEPTPAMLVLIPILLPAVEAFDISPLHFGIITILSLTLGMVTPPLGNVLYVMSAVVEVSFPQIVRAVAPFLIPLIAALLLVTFIPSISLLLPRILGFS